MKLRLIITVDYEADPRHYGTDDPTEMALIDYRNLVEGQMDPRDFLTIDDTVTVNYAIQPAP